MFLVKMTSRRFERFALLADRSSAESTAENWVGRPVASDSGLSALPHVFHVTSRSGAAHTRWERTNGMGDHLTVTVIPIEADGLAVDV